MLSQGYAFFEYVDTSVTDVAIQSLNGMEIGDKYLVVQRASVGAKPGMPNLPYDQFPEIPCPIMPAGENNTMDVRILLMLNMVTPEDLVDDQEYRDIYEDIKEESSRYGAVTNQERQDEIRVWRHGLPVRPRRTARRRSCWCRAGLRQVRKCAGCIVCAQGARRTVVHRAVYHRDGAEQGQSDDASLNLIFAPQPDAPPPLPSS